MPWVGERSLAPPPATLVLDESTTTFPDGVPPIDDIGQPIDELAFVLATDHLSMLEKIRMLEQWRYDELLMQNGATEGLGCGRADGGLLQQISKALLALDRACH